MKLIDKDALVTEIEKTINEPYPKHDQQCDWEDGYCSGLYKALNIIENTIEVKEVDLEKELDEWMKYGPHTNYPWCTIPDAIKITAEHFFELGLKAQQNISIDITNIDKIIEENGVDPNSKEAKMFKESYYMALEKLKAQQRE